MKLQRGFFFLIILSFCFFYYMVFTNITLNCYFPISSLELRGIFDYYKLNRPSMWYKDFTFPFKHEATDPEKIANYAVILPDSVWTSVSIDDLFANYLIFVLFLPLFYCFFSLLYLL